MDSAFLLGAIKELGDQQAARRAEARAREDAENKARAELLQHVWDATVAGKFSKEMYGVLLKDQLALAAQGKRPTKKGVSGAFSWEPEQIQGGLLDALLSGEYDAPTGAGGAPAALPAPSAAPSAGGVPEASFPSMTSSVPPPPLAAAPGAGPSRASDSGSALRFSTAPDGATFTNRLFAAPPTPPAPRVPLANFGAPSLGATIPPPPVPAPPQAQSAPHKLSDFVVDPVAEAVRKDAALRDAETRAKLENIQKGITQGLFTQESAKPWMVSALTGAAPVLSKFDDVAGEQPLQLKTDYKTRNGQLIPAGSWVRPVVDRNTGEFEYTPSGAPKSDLAKYGAEEQAVIQAAVGYPVQTNADFRNPQDINKAIAAIQHHKGLDIRNENAQLQLALATAKLNEARNMQSAEPLRVDYIPNTTTDNEADPILKVSPNAIFTAAVNDATGVPNAVSKLVQGRGSTGPAQLIRASVANTKAALLQKAGVSERDLQAEAKAGGAALSKATEQYTLAKGAADAADMNLDNVLEQSKNVPRGQSPALNKIVQVFQRNGEGEKELSKFDQLIYTAIREYQKVVTGSSASNAPLTDTAAKELTKLVNAAQNPEQLKAVVDSMRMDMKSFMQGKLGAVRGATGKNSATERFLTAIAGNTPYAGIGGDEPSSIPPEVDASFKKDGMRNGKLVEGAHTVFNGVTYTVKNGKIVRGG